MSEQPGAAGPPGGAAGGQPAAMSGSESAPRPPLVIRTAGALGVGGCIAGLGIFLAACAGQSGALKLSPLPLALGAAGLLWTIVAGALARQRRIETTQLLASIFTNICAIAGGLVEMAAWLGWTTFR